MLQHLRRGRVDRSRPFRALRTPWDKGRTRSQSSPKAVPLAQGKGLVPLGDEYWRKSGYSSQPICREWEARTTGDDEFENSEERQHCIDKAATAFAWIAAQCAQLCSAPSATLAYVEADYFGGVGTQAVAVWEGGHLVFGPVVSDKAIDRALARIGIKAGIRDEFDELQLGRCRMTSDWLALAGATS